MRIVNFGSLNIDHVYRVVRFGRPGETIACLEYRRYAGGKGLNQSVALARAGATIHHAGKTGKDGLFLKKRLKDEGVNVSCIGTAAHAATGHAVIQVDGKGQNIIVIYGGANRTFTKADVAEVLVRFSAGDCVLVQNEINLVPEIITQAKGKKMTVFFNPAPMSKSVPRYPLAGVDYLILNENEGAELTGEHSPGAIAALLRTKYPDMAVILTRGAKGAMYADRKEKIRVPAEKTVPVDTTAAGDTFIGYFIAEITRGKPIRDSLDTACRAAAVCVTRKGSADSIPSRHEIA